MGVKEILGASGHNKVCADGAVGKFSALPREVSYGPARRSWVAGRISPRGEIASDAVREVGVTRGTAEPRNNRNLGTVVLVRRRAMTQKASSRGRGHGGNGESGVMSGE